MFCRLEALVDTIIAEVGGRKVASFEFMYRGEDLSLQWKGDMKFLVQNHGELNNYMMKWIRVWLNPQLEHVKYHVCSPYIGPLLLAYVEEQRKDALEEYVNFIHDKYGALPSQDIKTLIVPYTCGNYWTVYIVGEHGFFHLDSLVESGLHFDIRIEKRLAKLWAAWSGHDTDDDMWMVVSSSRQWI